MEIYLADTLYDGSGQEGLKNVEVYVENGVVQEILPAGVRPRPENAIVYENPGKVMLPGFVDVHTHLMFGTPRSYEDVIYNDSDELMLFRGPRNAYAHLRAGVTTLRDCGARNKVGFGIKEGAEAGLFLSPRLLVCGRPLTITGGHFWWCGQEADGVDGVRKSVRQLLKEGADFLKIMASGGGTLGTDSNRASFTVDELKAAVEEVHQVGKRATAHCLAADAVARAAEAGIDQIEHFNFLRPDGTRVFDEAVAEMIVKKGLYVSPTIQTGYRQIQALEKKVSEGTITPKESKQLEGNRYKLQTKLSFVQRFHQMGAKIVMGTDAIREFGDYAVGLELLSRAGLTPQDLIVSATSRAAQALGLNNVGLVSPGYSADFVYLDRDPLQTIDAFGQVAAVVFKGQLVVDKRIENSLNIPVLAKNQIALYPL